MAESSEFSFKNAFMVHSTELTNNEHKLLL